MAEPHWTAYVGMATGILGAVTGISGAIMGYISYRRSNSIKALDLRLELRKAVNGIDADLSGLGKLMDYANKSRQRVAAATGKAQSGAMVLWDKEFGEDKAKLESLLGKAPSSSESYDCLSPTELESKLVAAHKLQGEISQLKGKYQASLAADDEERKEIREDMRTWTRNAK